MWNRRVTKLFTIIDNDDDGNKNKDEDEDKDDNNQEDDKNNGGQDENDNNDDFVVSFDWLKEICRFCKKQTTHFSAIDVNKACKFWQLKKEIKEAMLEMVLKFIFQNDMIYCIIELIVTARIIN